jgi:hypothetical protein
MLLSRHTNNRVDTEICMLLYADVVLRSNFKICLCEERCEAFTGEGEGEGERRSLERWRALVPCWDAKIYRRYCSKQQARASLGAKGAGGREREKLIELQHLKKEARQAVSESSEQLGVEH